MKTANQSGMETAPTAWPAFQNAQQGQLSMAKRQLVKKGTCLKILLKKESRNGKK